MTGSFVILGFFVLGIVLAYFGYLPEFVLHGDISSYVLYGLMFFVWVSIWADKKAFGVIKNAHVKIFLVPLAVIIGSLVWVSIASFFVSDVSLKNALAIWAWFGYYSLSSIFITQISGHIAWVTALLSNILREIITLLFTPLLAKYFGKIAPIAAGWATAMDTTLPIITQYTGKEYAVISVCSWIVLTILVPFLVNFILSF